MEQRLLESFGLIFLVKMYKLEFKKNTIESGIYKVKKIIAMGTKHGINITAKSMQSNAMIFLEKAMQAHRVKNPKTQDATGLLMSNINVHLVQTFNLTKEDYKAYVFTHVPYAPAVEYPNHYEGYYFMTNAFKKGKSELKPIIVAQIKKQLSTNFKVKK
jgi:hypothetical protein